MAYTEMKNDLIKLININYELGMSIEDIRAALHAADIVAEKYGALEVVEVAKAMSMEIA